MQRQFIYRDSVMDIKRRAFEEAFKNNNAYNIELIHGTNTPTFEQNSKGEYLKISVQNHWEMWQQAQKVAVPEGFVLVPKDDLLTVLCNCSDAMGDESTSSVYDKTGEPSTWFDHHVVAEKNILSSIPDAQEQVG